MITLNDANQYNWKISYKVLNGTNLETLIEGSKYDFIPLPSDIIMLEGNTYQVIGNIYDFDESTIVINLKSIKKAS